MRLGVAVQRAIVGMWALAVGGAGVALTQSFVLSSSAEAQAQAAAARPWVALLSAVAAVIGGSLFALDVRRWAAAVAALAPAMVLAAQLIGWRSGFPHLVWVLVALPALPAVLASGRRSKTVSASSDE